VLHHNNNNITTIRASKAYQYTLHIIGLVGLTTLLPLPLLDSCLFELIFPKVVQDGQNEGHKCRTNSGGGGSFVKWEPHCSFGLHKQGGFLVLILDLLIVILIINLLVENPKCIRERDIPSLAVNSFHGHIL
jgi:hypothetical protein